jgi:hypothetical protein
MSVPHANHGDFLTVIDQIGLATADGPLPVPLSKETDNVPSFGWVYADTEAARLNVIDLVPLSQKTDDEVAVAATFCEARYTTEYGIQTRVAGYIGMLHGVDPWERLVYDTIASRARPADVRVSPDANAVYGRMLAIASAAVDFTLREMAHGR